MQQVLAMERTVHKDEEDMWKIAQDASREYER